MMIFILEIASGIMAYSQRDKVDYEIKIILKNPLYFTPQYFNISTPATVFALKGVGL